MKRAGCRSWFDRPVLSNVEGLTTNGLSRAPSKGPFALSLSKGDGPEYFVRRS